MSDPGQPAPARPRKSAVAFRTIGEAADELDLPAHVLRFWETKFPQLKPVKRSGGRRYYRPEDILLLRRIRQWLYQDGYTIRGVQQLLESLPLDFAATGETRDIAGPLAAGHGANAGAASGSDTAPETDTATTSRLEASAAPGPIAGRHVSIPRRGPNSKRSAVIWDKPAPCSMAAAAIQIVMRSPVPIASNAGLIACR